MKISQQFKSFVINHPASSLYSLIADSKYRATSLGRKAWKKLIGSKASLQHNYNKEGFNVIGIHKARLKQGLVSLETTRTTAATVTPGLGLALEATTMTPTRVATKLLMDQIVATSRLKRWDTCWFNKCCNKRKQPSKGL